MRHPRPVPWILCAALLPSTAAAQAAASPQPTDPAEFARHIRPFLAKHCYKCHGKRTQKAGLALHDIDGVITNGKDIVRWEKVQEFVFLREMPPKKRRNKVQEIDRKRFLAWVDREIGKIGRGFDEARLALPSQGNRVDHEALFSGAHKGPASSPPRLWRKSPFAYGRFARNMRVQLAQPFLGMGGKGFQDYAQLYADESTIQTMLRNAGLVAEKLLEVGPRTRFRYLFEKNPKRKRTAKQAEENLQRGLRDIFRILFQRDPTAQDRATFIAKVFAKNRKLGGLRLGLKTMITAMLMSPEFVFRMEVGLGEKLPDGRRMLSPNELAYALSYAFYDKLEPKLLKAAAEGKLTTKTDVEREVRRMYNRREHRYRRYWNYPMYHRWGEDYYENNPRLLRFFQEFFGYTAAPDVFKDKERNHDHHANRLRKDADFLVLSALAADRHVFETLLTTNQYPVDFFWRDRAAELLKKVAKDPGDRKYQHKRLEHPDLDAILAAGQWPGIDSSHASAYLPKELLRSIRRAPGEAIALPREQRAGMLTHPAWLVAHSGNFDNDIVRRGKWIRERLLAGIVPDVPIGVDAKVPEDPHRTLRERFAVVKPAECWRCHKKMNPLGNAFEHYDDFGRYRKQILVGDVDGYLKKKRQFEGRRQNFRKRIQSWIERDAAGRKKQIAKLEKERKRAEQRLAELLSPNAKARQQNNYKAQVRQQKRDIQNRTKRIADLEGITDAHRERELQRERQRLAKHLETRPVPQSKPVHAAGVLDGTGDPNLDGPVRDAIDLTQRLAKSARVRQSILRHAFRYWMGRNETLSDSPTLMAMDRAYLESDGSFEEALVALLTSDSFLLRN